MPKSKMETKRRVEQEKKGSKTTSSAGDQMMCIDRIHLCKPTGGPKCFGCGG